MSCRYAPARTDLQDDDRAASLHSVTLASLYRLSRHPNGILPRLIADIEAYSSQLQEIVQGYFDEHPPPDVLMDTVEPALMAFWRHVIPGLKSLVIVIDGYLNYVNHWLDLLNWVRRGNPGALAAAAAI